MQVVALDLVPQGRIRPQGLLDAALHVAGEALGHQLAVHDERMLRPAGASGERRAKGRPPPPPPPPPQGPPPRLNKGAAPRRDPPAPAPPPSAPPPPPP